MIGKFAHFYSTYLIYSLAYLFNLIIDILMKLLLLTSTLHLINLLLLEWTCTISTHSLKALRIRCSFLQLLQFVNLSSELVLVSLVCGNGHISVTGFVGVHGIGCFAVLIFALLVRCKQIVHWLLLHTESIVPNPCLIKELKITIFQSLTISVLC